MNQRGSTSHIFLKLLVFEVKRYFSNPALIVISCIVPILLIMSILGSLLPFLFKGAEINDINIALFNEDPSFETNLIIKHLAESDSVEDFVEIIDVSSFEEGRQMIEDGEVSAMICIPEGMQESLYMGNSETLSFYAGDSDKQIVILLYDMIKGGLDNINQAQKSVDIIYYAMQDMGYERNEAVDEYRDMSESLFMNIISRSDIYIDYNEISATGDYLNIEYYLISILLLALFFLALPIGAKMSRDKLSGVLDRGGFYLHSFSYASAKMLAGGIFLILPAAVSTIFILFVSGAFGLFSGDVFLLIAAVILASFFFTSIMLLIGTYSSSTTAAIWTEFSVALIVSMISGIFIPRSLLPRAVTSIAEITGLPSIIRLFGYSLFGVKSTGIANNILVIILIIAAAFTASYFKTRKRLVRR